MFEKVVFVSYFSDHKKINSIDTNQDKGETKFEMNENNLLKQFFLPQIDAINSFNNR